MLRNFNAPRCSYKFRVSGDTLVLYDMDGPRSLTNDMERALAEIANETGLELNGRRIIYEDSEGRWDGVEFHEGTVRFYSINTDNEADALRRALQLRP